MENNFNEEIQYFDLTIPQENIWLIEQLNQNTNINNIYGTLFINKKIDLDILKKAINRIIENNDAFRIRITEFDSRPLQYIQEYQYEDIPVYFVDDNEENKINHIIETIGLEHMNLINNKLYDIRIIYNSNYVYICVKMHHIITDAWSMAQLFVEHLSLFYSDVQENRISEKKPSYLDYINRNNEYRKSDKYLRDQKFWQKYVENLSCTNEYPIVKNKKSNRIEKAISHDLYKKIENFCKKNNVSEYSFFLSIISVYFSKLFDSENIVIGTPFLNRQKSKKELDMMGMFVSTLPININVSKQSTFVELCKQIVAKNLSCFKHSNFPYTEIQKEYSQISDENINLYEIAFSYQMNNLESDFDSNIYKNTWFPNGFQTNPLLISYVNHFGEHQLCYDYLIKLFDEVDIDNLHERLLTIIQQILKNNHTVISNIQILCNNDITLLQEFNNTGNIKIEDETIVSRFKKIVQKNKTKIALKYNDIEVTYQELDQKSNSVANSIIKQKIKKGSPISIIFDKSIEMFVAMLGIMKAGCYYIPILPEEEQKRAEFIIQDSESQALITDRKYSTQIKNTIIENQLVIDNLLDEDTSEPNININPTDLCYLIYTSGSTGTPKGVMIKHENVISLLTSLNYHEDLKFLPGDIAISLLKYSFDASAIDIYSMLLNGGKLILIPKKVEFFAEEIVDIMEKENVTRTFIVSKWLEQIQNILIKNKSTTLSHLRILGTGGEVLKPEKFRYLFEQCPNLNIYNAYGPTETTMFVTVHKINQNDIIFNRAPIGKLLPFSRALVISQNSNEVLPINTKGELAILEDELSSKNIAAGYFNSEERTKKRFTKIINPFTNKLTKVYKTGDFVKINNNLEIDFLGRKDDFIKINGGYLVSLNEIDRKIQNILGNSIESCALAIPIRNVNTIILYIVKNNISMNIKIEDIRNEINNHITFYMRPQKIIEIDKLPLTRNGKIHKRLLEQEAIKYFENKNTYILPTNKTEQQIYDVVKEIVNSDFSITDDFEDDLGIDSLNITILYSKLNNNKISIQDLYNYPTVKDLAHLIRKEGFQNEPIDTEPIKILNASNQMDLEKVLLTGTTGFVGIHLLKELVDNDNTKKIYCIVRQKLNLTSEERFDTIIHNYFDEETCKRIKKKAVVLNGDLRKDNLGLEQNTFNRVFKDVKTIVNPAANVKHIGKYNTSYTDNVETVNNLIKVCLDFNISLAHISTLSLNGYYNENVSEVFTENTLNINQTFNKNPYLITKFEAEQTVLNNIAKNNLNAKIFRIGNIMPRISDGVFQVNYDQNGFVLALHALSQLQVTTDEMMNTKLLLTPVDDCCKSIVEILSSDYCNTIYHIENAKKIKLSAIIEMFRERNIDFSIVSPKAFEKAIMNNYSVGIEHLKAILSNKQNKYNSNVTCEILEQLNFEWQPIKKSYLDNLVSISMKIKGDGKNGY